MGKKNRYGIDDNGEGFSPSATALETGIYNTGPVTDDDTTNSGTTVTEDDLSKDDDTPKHTSVVEDPEIPDAEIVDDADDVDSDITGAKLLDPVDLPGSAPQRKDYTTYMNMVQPWLIDEKEYNEETEKRKKQSGYAQGILRLGQALHALGNLWGTSKGAGVQAMPKVKDYDLREWLKSRDEKVKQSEEARNKAMASDYQEWLAAKKTYDTDYANAVKENQARERTNAKALNDLSKLFYKTTAQADRDKILHEYRMKQIEERGKWGVTQKQTSSGSKSSSGSGSGNGGSSGYYKGYTTDVSRLSKLFPGRERAISALKPSVVKQIIDKLNSGATTTQVGQWISSGSVPSGSGTAGSTSSGSSASKPKANAPYLKKK